MRKKNGAVFCSGQILLIVVLIMIVALTVGLSVAARILTATRNTADEASSQRAFSAAEAGIERSLTNNSGTTGNFASNNSSYTTTVTQLIGQDILIDNNTAVFKDTPTDIWLSQAPNYTNPWTGNITIYWGQAGDFCSPSEAANTMAALEMVIIDGTKANPQIVHYTADPCGARRGHNNFGLAGGGGIINGTAFSHSFSIAVTNGLLLTIIPLYASTSIGLAGCNQNNLNCKALPSQGTVISSVGTSGTATRKIVSVKTVGTVPMELFPYILFSP